MLIRSFLLTSLLFLSGCFLTKEKLFDTAQSQQVFSSSVMIYANPKEFVAADFLAGAYIPRREGTPKGARIYSLGNPQDRFFVLEESGSGRITQNAPDYSYALFKLIEPAFGQATLEIPLPKKSTLYAQLVERRGLKFQFIGPAAKAENGVAVLAVLNDLMRNWDDLERGTVQIFDLTDASDLKKATHLVGKEALR